MIEIVQIIGALGLLSLSIDWWRNRLRVHISFEDGANPYGSPEKTIKLHVSTKGRLSYALDRVQIDSTVLESPIDVAPQFGGSPGPWGVEWRTGLPSKPWTVARGCPQVFRIDTLSEPARSIKSVSELKSVSFRVRLYDTEKSRHSSNPLSLDIDSTIDHDPRSSGVGGGKLWRWDSD